jgi:hypothetical protein
LEQTAGSWLALLICVFACVFTIDVLLCKPSSKPDPALPLQDALADSLLRQLRKTASYPAVFSDVRLPEFQDFRGEEEIDG